MKFLLFFLLGVCPFLIHAQSVNAGPDSTLTISPTGTRWNQTGTDTGYLQALPNGITGTTISYLWTQVSGPNTARILYPTNFTTPIDNLVVGTYVFQVAATGSNGTFTDQVTRTVRLCTPGTPEYHLSIGGDGGAFLGDMSGYVPGARIWLDSATFPSRTYIFGEKLKGAPGCYVSFKVNGYCEGKNVAFDVSGDWGEIDGTPTNAFTKKRTKTGIYTTVTTSLFFDGKWKDTLPTGFVEIFNQTGSPAITLQRASTNWYIHDLEIRKRKYAFGVKDDDGCDTTLNYPNGVMRDNLFTRIYAHYTESQDIYMGNTAPNNSTLHIREKNCPALPCGAHCFLEPGRQGDNEISYCIFDSSGRSNIQPSVQEVGMSRFHHNQLSYPGTQKDEAQGVNIFLGGYSQALVDSNNMKNALTFNANAFGTRSYWYDNVMDSAGYGAYAQRWVWDGTPGFSNVIGVQPDSAWYIAYGSAFQARANLTSPVDKSRVWMKNNNAHAERTADLNNGDKSVIYLYSSGGMDNSLVWATDNAFDNNTYNGSVITAPWQVQAQAGISFSATAVNYINRVSAGRDVRITHNWHELIGKAQALNGTAIIATSWEQVSGPSTATISNASNMQTYVSGLVNGRYVFKFSATNSAEIVTEDTMIIDVSNVVNVFRGRTIRGNVKTPYRTLGGRYQIKRF